MVRSSRQICLPQTELQETEPNCTTNEKGTSHFNRRQDDGGKRLVEGPGDIEFVSTASEYIVQRVLFECMHMIVHTYGYNQVTNINNAASSVTGHI
jgi:hypothetical protein